MPSSPTQRLTTYKIENKCIVVSTFFEFVSDSCVDGQRVILIIYDEYEDLAFR